jgi:DNA-binding FadR family transcriptional regulator
VQAALIGSIERGELKAGDKLPSERELAASLTVGRTTVRLVLARLVAQGVVEAQHGRGYFVVRRTGRKKAPPTRETATGQ